jgi:integrase
VANCLTSEIIGKGLGLAMARKFLSMCSVTHRLLHHEEKDFSPLDENTTIKMILAGVRKHRPPPVLATKDAPYFSLAALFVHVRTMSSDDNKCDISTLRDKCIVLLMIDAMARPSDIETIDRDEVRATPSALTYQYYFTKEAKARGLQPASIAAFTQDPAICTVRCVETYLRRTVWAIVATRDRLVNGVNKKRAPLFLSSYRTKKGEEMWGGLGTERIAKVVKETMGRAGITGWNAKHIRGAASSKCRNLGLPESTIIARARWAAASTFRANYWRACTYSNMEPAHAAWPIERLLRFTATRA